jgi:hypothetical protein
VAGLRRRGGGTDPDSSDVVVDGSAEKRTYGIIGIEFVVCDKVDVVERQKRWLFDRAS